MACAVTIGQPNKYNVQPLYKNHSMKCTVSQVGMKDRREHKAHSTLSDCIKICNNFSFCLHSNTK
jgi:hypothetical protein